MQIEEASKVKKKLNRDNDLLFPSSASGGHISRNYIQARLRDAAIKCFGKEAAAGITPHSLRRSIGSILVDTGMPIDSVAAFLRHNTTTLMAYYNKANEEQFKNDLQEIRPKLDEMFDFEKRIAEKTRMSFEQFICSGSYFYFRSGLIERWNTLNKFYTYPNMIEPLKI